MAAGTISSDLDTGESVERSSEHEGIVVDNISANAWHRNPDGLTSGHLQPGGQVHAKTPWAWLVVDVDSTDEARSIVPPAYRPRATIVELCRFGFGELDDLIKRHEGR